MEIEATGRFSAADLEPTRVAVHWTGQIGTGAVRDQVLRLQPCLMSDVQSSKSGFSLGIKMTAAMIALIAMVSAGIYFSLLSHEKQSLVAAKENAGRMVFHLFGENTSSALLFADEEGISKGLQQLGENPEVLYAAVWAIDDPDTGAKGKLMGEFRRPDFSGKFETPAVVREAIVTTGSETLAINDAVTQRQGGRIGQALVVFSLQRELAALENAKSGIMLVAAAVASLLSILLFIAVRLIVVSPLKRVVGAADGLRHGNRQLLELNSMPLT